jgi:hypothetical protein
MTKKHFVEAARYIRERLSRPDHAAAVDLIVHLGHRFNPRFDEHRFRTAAGDGEGMVQRRSARRSA